MNRRSSLRLMGWPMPPISGDVRQLPIFAPFVHLAGGKLHRLDDVLVSRTAAQVAGDSPTNLFLRGIWILRQQCVGGHQHARGTESALQTVLFLESLLQGMQLAV